MSAIGTAAATSPNWTVLPSAVPVQSVDGVVDVSGDGFADIDIQG